MIFKSVISDVNSFRMEKITRGPEIIFRGGRILRGSHGFSGVKEGGEGGGDQSSPTEFKGRTIEN